MHIILNRAAFLLLPKSAYGQDSLPLPLLQNIMLFEDKRCPRQGKTQKDDGTSTAQRSTAPASVPATAHGHRLKTTWQGWACCCTAPSVTLAQSKPMRYVSDVEQSGPTGSSISCRSGGGCPLTRQRHSQVILEAPGFMFMRFLVQLPRFSF